jgi:hypothetical protein
MRRLRPARLMRQFDLDGCRTAGFSRLARILERQDQREVAGFQKVELCLETVSLQSKLLDEMVDDLGQVIKRVVELIDRRRRAVTESRVVWGDEMIFIGKRRYQIPEPSRQNTSLSFCTISFRL